MIFVFFVLDGVFVVEHCFLGIGVFSEYCHLHCSPFVALFVYVFFFELKGLHAFEVVFVLEGLITTHGVTHSIICADVANRF